MAGRGSGIMELTAGCRDMSSVPQSFDCLTDVSRCFQTGSCPRQSAADVAHVIFSGVCGPVPGEDRECPPAESCDLTCISVSLVDRITSDLMSRSLPPALASYCGEVLTVFQDMDLMSQLVQLFQAEDQIMSHVAAKSASSCVFYQLLKSVSPQDEVWTFRNTEGTISPVWQQKCAQTFCSSALGPELDACLWSLTEVLKRLVKGAHQDLLGKLVAAFDSSLSALCSTFLPEERKEVMQCLEERWGTTFCLLLDLLEVLTASSLMCGAGVCLKSQRITHTHCSALLTTISCCSEYFVKKRALLLLKRAVLQKAGEDWASGDVLSSGVKHKHFNSDMSLLAHSVLTAVGADWLQSVQVESDAFFGGTRCVRVEEGQKPDCVMLRAVSLLLLKSMELHIQTAGGTAGVDSAAEVSGYLQSLWGFLRQCGVQLTEVTHHCCWISLLFGEQDDDMMEAAKALLSIFLHHRLCSGLEDSAVLEAACASGCNPHCHFLLLLQSISFDHSILLDFLISTETCFLEYFVRYLKYLRADWPGFTAACGRVSSPQLSLTASCGGDMSKVTCKGQPDGVELSSCDQPMAVTSAVGAINPAAGFHLVEYDSSDESEPENMEVCQEEALAAVCVNITTLDVKQETNSTPERRPEGPSLPLLLSEETSSPGPQVTCKTLSRAVLCMSALREVVTRLQTKKLFPYNPSSLLKLLAQVENCS